MKKTILILTVMMGMLVASYAAAQNILGTQNPQVFNPNAPYPYYVMPGRDYHGSIGRSGKGEALQPAVPESEGKNPNVPYPYYVMPGRDYHGSIGRSGTGEALQPFAAYAK